LVNYVHTTQLTVESLSPFIQAISIAPLQVIVKGKSTARDAALRVE